MYREGDLYCRYAGQIFFLRFPLRDPYLPSVFRVRTTANLSQEPGTMTIPKQSSATLSTTFCVRINRHTPCQPGNPARSIALHYTAGAIR